MGDLGCKVLVWVSLLRLWDPTSLIPKYPTSAKQHNFILFLFSLVKPLNVGVVNLVLRCFCSDEMGDGTEKPPVDVLIKGLMFTA